MFKFTKTLILYIVITIFFISIQLFINQYKIKSEINEEIMIEQQENFAEDDLRQNIELDNFIVQNDVWQIEIPKISLVAYISEGTTKEILSQYVGHFATTQKESGNIGLAAHNRGYEVNYFQDLKLLKDGDVIKYKHNEFEMLYEVEKCRIIKDTEWKYLENTEDNRLTLITCVENQPEYRRCIQAVEKEEDRY